MASYFHAKRSRHTVDGGLSSWRTSCTPNRRNTWKKYAAECSTTETQAAPRYPSPIADFLSRYKVRVAPRGQGAVRVVHRKRRNDRRRRWKISLCVTSMDDAFPIDSTDTTGVFSHVSLRRLCVKRGKQQHPYEYVRISWSVRFRGWTFGNAVRGMRWGRLSRDTTRILIVSRGGKDVCRVGEKEVPVTLTGVGRYSN